MHIKNIYILINVIFGTVLRALDLVCPAVFVFEHTNRKPFVKQI